MNGDRRILLNAALLVVGEGAGQLVNLLFVMAFARHYGSEQLGDYSYAMAVGGVAGLFVSLGMNGYLTRELARRAAEPAALLGLLVPLQLALTGTTAVLGGAFVVLTSAPAAAAAVVLTLLAQLLYRFGTLLYVPFRAAEQMRTPVCAEVVYRLATLGFAVLLMQRGAAAATTLLSTVAGAFAWSVAGWMLFARRFGPVRLRIDVPAVREVLEHARGFFGLALISTLNLRAGALLLGLFGSRDALGHYAVADRLVFAAALTPLMLAQAAVPTLSREAAHSRAGMIERNARLLRLTLAGGSVIAAAVIWSAPWLVALYVGSGFESSVQPLRVLACVVPLLGAEQLLSAQLTALGQVQRLVRVRTVSLFAYVVLGTAGVLLGSATGLACAVVVIALLQLLVVMRALRQERALPALWG